MENELVTLAAVKATLKKTQFTKIEAIRSASDDMQKGKLTVTTEIGLKRNKNGTPDALSTITIEVVGMPDASAEGDPPAFTIKVAIHGVYTWDTALDPSVFEGDSLSPLLAKPLHVLAVSEVHSLARKLALNGVQLKWEVPTPKVVKPRKNKSASKKLDITTVTPKVKRLPKKISSV